MGLLSQDTERGQRIDHSLALLRQPVPAGVLWVLVGHSSNIAETTGAQLPEGAAVLVRSDAAQGRGFVVLGRLLPADWRALAQGV